MASTKIIKPNGQTPDEFEQSIAQALVDLENNAAELKADLAPLYISSAREVDVGGGRKAIVVFVPVPLLRQFQKIQARLVRELEKKFSGKHVVFIAQRRILRKETRHTRAKQPRPRSRTLTAVHDAILEDVCYPTEIVGKRLRFKLDGSRVIKVHLDSKDKANIEYKTDTFRSVYRQLTGKDVTFEFPAAE
eukprot:comp12005_c0_seq1/m.6694 comp12005_c0_seq1/g.6694  ORF comp12005_c0_seq1/g.6694 comp12005_c0_seq1/m.6694 type:complete len:191 (-) comp12005_c0_seq1:54-626(-)